MGLKPDVPTFVIAECLFCYLEQEHTQQMLEIITSYFTGDLALANYDIQKPDDPFGQTMISNLESRHCSLLGIKKCPDVESQQTRLLNSGFAKAEARSMLLIHNTQLDQDERLRIEKLEIFDEFEEWDLLMDHYLICVGSRFEEGELGFN